MKTQYQQFLMQPAPKAAIAKRLLGAPGRVTGVAPSIWKSNAPTTFFRDAYAARNLVAPSGMSPYPLGDQGGLAGFGAVDAKFVIVGNIGFNEAWSFEDWEGKSGWLNHIRYWKLATYEPLDDIVKTRAQQKWDALYTAAQASEQAYQLYEVTKTSISNAADAVDRNTKTADMLGRYSDASHRDRARLLTALNTAIRNLANMTIPSAPPANPGLAVNTGGTTPGGSMLYPTGGSSWTPPGQTTSTGAATGGGIPTGMLALGAVAAIGVGVWLLKRKKS